MSRFAFATKPGRMFRYWLAPLRRESFRASKRTMRLSPWRLSAGRQAALLALAIVCMGSALFAQDSAPPSGGGTTVVVRQQVPYMEAIIVLVLVGLALFAVCRSSRRN